MEVLDSSSNYQWREGKARMKVLWLIFLNRRGQSRRNSGFRGSADELIKIKLKSNKKNNLSSKEKMLPESLRLQRLKINALNTLRREEKIDSDAWAATSCQYVMDN